MSKKKQQWRNYVVFGSLLIGFLTYQSVKNSLVTLEEGVQTSRRALENQLERRYDFVPALLSSQAGASKRAVNAAALIANLKATLPSTQSQDQFKIYAQIESEFQTLLDELGQVPKAKNNSRYETLKQGVEISNERFFEAYHRYNETVKYFNRVIRKVPHRWVANQRELHPHEAFQLDLSGKTPEIIIIE